VEFQLAVGAQIFVAESTYDLEVLSSPDHQDLLENLRELRQRNRIARDARGWAQEIARAFRS